MRCTSNSAPAWRPSPATICRSNILWASSASICTREASAGLFDVSHMGQALLEGAVARGRRALSRNLVPGGYSVGLAPGRQRYTQMLNDDGRHRRRPDGRARRPAPTGALRLVVNASRKAVDFACIRGRSSPRRAADAAAEARADRACRGRLRRRRLARACARRVARDDVLHERQRRARRRVRDLRLALRLHRRGRLRDFAVRRRRPKPSRGALLREPDVGADRARRARFAAARSRALPLRP